jgi:hypothetical protein
MFDTEEIKCRLSCRELLEMNGIEVSRKNRRDRKHGA